MEVSNCYNRDNAWDTKETNEKRKKKKEKKNETKGTWDILVRHQHDRQRSW